MFVIPFARKQLRKKSVTRAWLTGQLKWVVIVCACAVRTRADYVQPNCCARDPRRPRERSCQTATEIWVRRFFVRRGRRAVEALAPWGRCARLASLPPTPSPTSSTTRCSGRPTDQPYITTTCLTLSEYYIWPLSMYTGKLNAILQREESVYNIHNHLFIGF